MQVRSAVGVETQHRGQGVEHLRRRSLVAALLEPNVVIGADSRKHCDLLAAQTANATPPTTDEAYILGVELLAARSKVPTERLVVVHRSTVDPEPG